MLLQDKSRQRAENETPPIFEHGALGKQYLPAQCTHFNKGIL